jgi:hypothetical protein
LKLAQDRDALAGEARQWPWQAGRAMRLGPPTMMQVPSPMAEPAVDASSTGHPGRRPASARPGKPTPANTRLADLTMPRGFRRWPGDTDSEW